MGINGHGIPDLRKPPRVDFEFTEVLYRRIAGEIKESISQQGGALMMPDPTGFLAIILVLDKLDAISARLDKIESAIAHPFRAMPQNQTTQP